MITVLILVYMECITSPQKIKKFNLYVLYVIRNVRVIVEQKYGKIYTAYLKK